MSVAENAGTISVTVNRTGGSDGEVSATISVGGTASSEADYTVPTTVTFASGATSATIALTLIDDDDAEEDETVTLTTPTGGASLGDARVLSVTITNDDAPDAPDVSLFASPKHLVFAWDAVPTATHYRLLSERLLPDGATTGLVPALPDITSGTTARLPISVHLHDWSGMRYRVSACNAAGCTNSRELETNDRDLMLDAIGTLVGSNTEPLDLFGASIAMSADGSTIAIGAPLEESSARGVNGDQEDNSAFAAGAVYVFTRSSSGEWVQQAYLKASNTVIPTGSWFAFFGASVSLSDDGNTLAVGAPGEASSSTGVNGNQQNFSAEYAGAVYIFNRDAEGSWTQTAYIKASNTGAGDFFGSDVSLSGDGRTLAVGAPDEDGGAILVNGADDDSQPESGAVYVFELRNSQWTQVAYIKPHLRFAPLNTSANVFFGHSIAMDDDGDTLAIATSFKGVYVYVKKEGSWGLENLFTAGPFGIANQVSISADGDTIVAAQVNPLPAVDPTSGAAYVFNRTAPGIWSHTATVQNQIADASDEFGVAVAISADARHLIVGAPGEDSSSVGVGGNPFDKNAQDSGAAYHFIRNDDGTWTEAAYIKAPVSEEGALFAAQAIAMSDDASVLAVSQFGKVFLY